MALNVLVVDDSQVMRSMITKTLKLSGVPVSEVYQAQNGEEGLNVLDQHWVDLALIDINMPVMNGAEMLAKIRENTETRDLAVIVVSTEGSDVRVNFIKSMGAAFVHKPFAPETLREAVFSVTGVSNESGSEERTHESVGLDF